MREDLNIRVLVADDDEQILRCYRTAFGGSDASDKMRKLDAMEADLFDTDDNVTVRPTFDLVACSQGDEAVARAEEAFREGQPFDVVILDVRMPPGMGGVDAGSEIRELDPDVEIIFITGFSDVPRDELEQRVPPSSKLHYFNKPLSFSQLAEDVASIIRERQESDR